MNGHREILTLEPQSPHHQGAADDLAKPRKTGQVLTAKKREKESPARANCLEPEASMTQARNLHRSSPRQAAAERTFGQAQFPYPLSAALPGTGASRGDSVRPSSLEVGRRPAASISVTNTQGGASQKLGPKPRPDSSVRF
jgi:hypothetical protein